MGLFVSLQAKTCHISNLLMHVELVLSLITVMEIASSCNFLELLFFLGIQSYFRRVLIESVMSLMPD